MDIFSRMKNSEPIDIRTDNDYKTIARKEMERSINLSTKANHLESPYDPMVRAILEELFNGNFPKSSMIQPPFHIDRACQMTVGENVFVNYGLSCMSSGGINIEDGVMIGPDVSLLTANHDLTDIRVLIFKPIHIKKNAWIGARAIILPGITIGEGAIVASGAVVTHNVEDFTVVAGNPARVIKKVQNEHK